MSYFSDLLSQHIQNSGKTKIQIAEAIGMTRTNFQKISTGARKLQNEHYLEGIINELILSPKEKEQLWEAYHHDTTGYKQYKMYVECIHFLNSFFMKNQSEIRTISKTILFNPQKELIILNSQDDLIQALSACLSTLQESEQKDIRIILQPEKSLLLKLLLPFLRSNQNVNIQHIICFDHLVQLDNCYMQLNLHRMASILDLILASPSYSAFYYYDSSEMHFQNASLFPNMILTNDALLLFDTSEKKGYYTNNKKLIKLYMEKFYEVFDQTTQIFSQHLCANRERKSHAIIAYQPEKALFSNKTLLKNTFFFTREGFMDFIHEFSDSQSQKIIAKNMLLSLKTAISSNNNFYLLKTAVFICLYRPFSFLNQRQLRYA